MSKIYKPINLKVLTKNITPERIKERDEWLKTQPKKRLCCDCGKLLPVEQYTAYTNNSGRWYIRRQCRLCYGKRQGVRQVGKVRLAATIINKGVKYCSRCKEYKPIEEFVKDKRKVKGRASDCKECHVKANVISQRKVKRYLRKIYGDLVGCPALPLE